MRRFCVLSVVSALVACSSAPHDAPANPTEAKPGPGACAYAREIADEPQTALERGIASWLAARTSADEAAALSRLDEACYPPAHSQDHRRFQDSQAACAVLGVMYTVGDGAPRNRAKANAYLAQSAYGPGTFDLGGCELDAPGRTEGIDRSSTACCRVAMRCNQGCDADCDRARARVRAKTFEAFEKGCAGGHKAACMLVALTYGAYLDGIGYVVDDTGWSDARVRKLYETLCSQGIGHACTTLARIIASQSDSEGKPIGDAGIAAGLYRRACDLGDGSGCIGLAKALRDGWTAQKGSMDELGAWDAACRHGMRVVCEDLAERHAQGNGVLKDAAKAATYRSLALPFPE